MSIMILNRTVLTGMLLAISVAATTEIRIKTPTGKITLYVEDNATISTVKDKIKNSLAIPPEQQHLMSLDGTELENDRTVSDFNIQQKSTLRLVLTISSAKMQLRVTMRYGARSGESILRDVKVKPSDTIQDVKAMIQDQEGIPPEQQRLMNWGDKMKDESTLDSIFNPKRLTHFNFKKVFKLYLEVLQIRVRMPSGELITLDVGTNDTIESVKAKIQAKEGIPVKQQRLMCGRQEFENNGTLGDFHGKRLRLLQRPSEEE